LVGAPAFHFLRNKCANGEVYNLTLRGGDHGSLGGIDIISANVYVHDVVVTNKDECITVKSLSLHLLIEQVYCN
jgi:rhamnogalacturonan hydrolase